MKLLIKIFVLILALVVIMTLLFTWSNYSSVYDENLYLKNCIVINEKLKQEIDVSTMYIERKYDQRPYSYRPYYQKANEINMISDSICSTLQNYIGRLQQEISIGSNHNYFNIYFKKSFHWKLIFSRKNKLNFNEFLAGIQPVFDKLLIMESGMRADFDKNICFIISSSRCGTNTEYLMMLNGIQTEVRCLQLKRLSMLESLDPMPYQTLVYYAKVKPVYKQYEKAKAIIMLIDYEPDTSLRYFIENKPVSLKSGKAIFKLATDKKGIHQINGKILKRRWKTGEILEYSVEYNYYVY